MSSTIIGGLLVTVYLLIMVYVMMYKIEKEKIRKISFFMKTTSLIYFILILINILN
ncbi:hypothetical protein Bp8pS_139 [Bacillus phage vB_BpuM-BpSp]|nr:hypothetical protein Bp8pS_139 [Bacillus phage vB_BpuM-BpSp]